MQLRVALVKVWAMILSVILSFVLVCIAALHVLWGIGYWTPIKDETALARAVVGFAGIDRMPGAVPCAMVAVALLGAVMCLWWPPGVWRSLAVGAIGAVFFARGTAAFTPIWRKLAPMEPFATLDRRFYGPLCLLLGFGFWNSL